VFGLWAHLLSQNIASKVMPFCLTGARVWDGDFSVVYRRGGHMVEDASDGAYLIWVGIG